MFYLFNYLLTFCIAPLYCIGYTYINDRYFKLNWSKKVWRKCEVRALFLNVSLNPADQFLIAILSGCVT